MTGRTLYNVVFKIDYCTIAFVMHADSKIQAIKIAEEMVINKLKLIEIRELVDIDLDK